MTRNNERVYAVKYLGIDRQSNNRHIEVVPFVDGLEFIQKQVDGYIEHYVISEYLNSIYIDLWINEEGKFRSEFEPVFALMHDNNVYDVIVGPCLFTSFNDDGKTFGLTSDEVNIVIKYLSQLSVVGLVNKDGQTIPVLSVCGE